MRPPLVVANWKMNGSCESIQALLEQLKSSCSSVDVAVLPPSIFMSQVSESLKGTSIQSRVAQDIVFSVWQNGAFTGEHSLSRCFQDNRLRLCFGGAF